MEVSVHLWPAFSTCQDAMQLHVTILSSFLYEEFSKKLDFLYKYIYAMVAAYKDHFEPT